MRILNIRTLSGPNTYSHKPVLVMTLDLEDLAGKESYEIPGFNDRLMALLPGVYEHHCGLGRPGGFIERLHGGTWFGHIVEHVALELTDAVGISTNRGKTVSAGKPGVFLVAVTYKSDPGMRSLLQTAVELVQALVDDKPYELAERIAEAKRIVAEKDLGPSTQAIADAASARGIPVHRLDGESSLVRLGHGKHTRLVRATMSSNTSVIGVDIAADKDLAKRLLPQAGFPVPQGCVVETVEQAIEAWQEVGSPAVVKPLDGNQGRGVSLNLTEAEQIRCAKPLR